MNRIKITFSQTILILTVLGIGGRAFALPSPKALAEIRPSWMDQKLGTQPENITYLESVADQPEMKEGFLSEIPIPISFEEPVDKSKEKGFFTRYQDILREFEARENADPTDSIRDQSKHERITSFSQYILKEIISHQVDRNVQNAEKHSEEVRTFQQLQKAVASQDAETSIESLDLQVGVRASLFQQKGSFWMRSPLFESKLDLSFGETWGRDPDTPVDTNALSSEAVKFSLTKELPLGVHSELAYGALSNLVQASFRKQLTRHFHVEVAAVRNLQSTASIAHDETVKFYYQMNF